MKTLTASQLAEMIRGFESPTIASFTAETIPKMVVKDRQTKLPNPYLNRVTKIARINGMVGNFDYSNVITNQRVREAKPETVEEVEAVPEYQAAPRQWGEHIEKTGLVEHQGKLYVRITNIRSIEHRYYIDGKEATEEQVAEIQKYLPVPKPIARHETEKDMLYRDYSLSNIREFRAGGNIYQIVPDNSNAA